MKLFTMIRPKKSRVLKFTAVVKADEGFKLVFRFCQNKICAKQQERAADTSSER
jgi:hypothetical protein